VLRLLLDAPTIRGEASVGVLVLLSISMQKRNAIGARRGPLGRALFGQMPGNRPARHVDQQVRAFETLPGARAGRVQAAGRSEKTRFQAKPLTALRRFRRSDHIPQVDSVVVASRPVRRILYRVVPVMAIPLGRRLPDGSCGLPEG
jgi:hypothetical protein